MQAANLTEIRTAIANLEKENPLKAPTEQLSLLAGTWKVVFSTIKITVSYLYKPATLSLITGKRIGWIGCLKIARWNCQWIILVAGTYRSWDKLRVQGSYNARMCELIFPYYTKHSEDRFDSLHWRLTQIIPAGRAVDMWWHAQGFLETF